MRVSYHFGQLRERSTSECGLTSNKIVFSLDSEIKVGLRTSGWHKADFAILIRMRDATGREVKETLIEFHQDPQRLKRQ